MQIVKGPTTISPLGFLPSFRKNPLVFLENLQNEYEHEDVIVYRLLNRTYYLVLNPSMIREALITKSHYFHKSKPFQELKSLVGEGLLTSEEEFHLQQRRLMQPAFTKQHIQTYADDMVSITKDHISSWDIGEKRQINMDMMNITLSIITKTMFDMDIREGHEKVGKHIDTALKTVTKRIRSIFKVPHSWPTKQNVTYSEALDAINQVIYEIIAHRREQKDIDREDLLSILMKARDEKSGEGMTDEQLRDEVMTIFLAGHETTANALTWSFYLLSQHPEKTEKVHEEIETVLEGRLPSYEDMGKLTYTQSVVWESLRLYPPAWAFGREVIRDVSIGEYEFSKGDTLIMSPYIIQRSSKYFPNPTVFEPERFEDGSIKPASDFIYFPFGGGPRVCIGNHFAMLEAVLVMGTILQRYRLELCEDCPEVAPDPLITLRPKNGIRMVVSEH
ncbi:cytochrome P450 [Bacillus songklensis]|uniref:Cytochrome P450 n=1 Tax=Bacillus songklensis TaxID=1069116 RepID=A0ABV8AWA8_9BACI